MSSKINEKLPIMVENPYTGRYVNIQPVLEIMRVLAEENVTPAGVAKALDKAIRYIALTIGEECTAFERNCSLFDLYRIRDAFEASTEFKKP